MWTKPALSQFTLAEMSRSVILQHSDAPLVLNFIKHSACSLLQDVKGSWNCGVLAVQRWTCYVRDCENVSKSFWPELAFVNFLVGTVYFNQDL